MVKPEVKALCDSRTYMLQHHVNGHLRREGEVTHWKQNLLPVKISYTCTLEPFLRWFCQKSGRILSNPYVHNMSCALSLNSWVLVSHINFPSNTEVGFVHLFRLCWMPVRASQCFRYLGSIYPWAKHTEQRNKTNSNFLE